MSSEQQKAPQSSQSVTEQRDLLDDIIDRSKLAKDEGARTRSRDLLQPFIDEILKGRMTIAPDTEAMINARIAEIDHLVSIQLNEVLHAPEFQKLEASWRGLRYLLDKSE